MAGSGVACRIVAEKTLALPPPQQIFDRSFHDAVEGCIGMFPD
jgi:hypothetical protein